MRRVLIVGRGGAGKSTLAGKLGSHIGVPVIELDKHFWQPGSRALPPEAWAEVQLGLAAQPCWVMEGDLGPYDVLSSRPARADTVVVLTTASRSARGAPLAVHARPTTSGYGYGTTGAATSVSC